MKIVNRAAESIVYLPFWYDTLSVSTEISEHQELFKGNEVTYKGQLVREILPGSTLIVPYNSNWEIDIPKSPKGKIYIFLFTRSSLVNYSWAEIVTEEIYFLDSFDVNKLQAIDWTIAFPPSAH